MLVFCFSKTGRKNNKPKQLLINTTITVGIFSSNCFINDIEVLRAIAPVIANRALKVLKGMVIPRKCIFLLLIISLNNFYFVNH